MMYANNLRVNYHDHYHDHNGDIPTLSNHNYVKQLLHSDHTQGWL